MVIRVDKLFSVMLCLVQKIFFRGSLDTIMLSSLHIKDFAIIDELSAEFGSGLNVLTGETGAGKTIIVQAIGMILGERMSGDSVRSGSERASVTAVFDLCEAGEEIIRYLADANIENGDELVVHRTISNDGKGRANVSGVPVAAAWLKKLGRMLVDVSSQHGQQVLLDPSRHASILDACGDSEMQAAAYRAAHAEFSEVARELDMLKRIEKSSKEKFDFLKFQVAELESANLRPGELEEIEADRMRLKNSVFLEEHSRAVEAMIYGGEGSALERIDCAIQAISQCAQFDAKTNSWKEAMSRARAELADVAREIVSYADGLQSDPNKLEELDERIHMLRQLVRKYGGSVESCLLKLAEIKDELNKIEHYDEILKEKQDAFVKVSDRRRKAAAVLEQARKVAAKKMGKAVESELKGLGMTRTMFAVTVKMRPEEEWDESGPSAVEFVISPNPGEPMMPIWRIASGGELSRVMLAIKCVLGKRGLIAAVSIFDEVDAGIGGAVAEVVGKKLKEVSKSRQVICITHLAQVAACADNHIRISKRVLNGRTVTELESIDGKNRETEIARMLGGQKLTNTTLAHAKEMLILAAEL